MASFLSSVKEALASDQSSMCSYHRSLSPDQRTTRIKNAVSIMFRQDVSRLTNLQYFELLDPTKIIDGFHKVIRVSLRAMRESIIPFVNGNSNIIIADFVATDLDRDAAVEFARNKIHHSREIREIRVTRMYYKTLSNLFCDLKTTALSEVCGDSSIHYIVNPHYCELPLTGTSLHNAVVGTCNQQHDTYPLSRVVLDVVRSLSSNIGWGSYSNTFNYGARGEQRVTISGSGPKWNPPDEHWAMEFKEYEEDSLGLPSKCSWFGEFDLMPERKIVAISHKADIEGYLLMLKQEGKITDRVYEEIRKASLETQKVISSTPTPATPKQLPPPLAPPPLVNSGLPSPTIPEQRPRKALPPIPPKPKLLPVASGTPAQPPEHLDETRLVQQSPRETPPPIPPKPHLLKDTTES